MDCDLVSFSYFNRHDDCIGQFFITAHGQRDSIILSCSGHEHIDTDYDDANDKQTYHV
jgi:hypothetical protein